MAAGPPGRSLVGAALMGIAWTAIGATVDAPRRQIVRADPRRNERRIRLWWQKASDVASRRRLLGASDVREVSDFGE